MELRLSIRSGHDRRDVLLEAARGASAAELRDALNRTTDQDHAVWTIARSGAPIDDDWSDALVEGDELVGESRPEPPVAAAWLLTVVGGIGAGTRRALRGSATVGRDAGADLTLDDDRLSGRHFEVREAGGSAEIRDLASTNGTWLADERVGAGERALHDDDVIRAGSTAFRVVRREAPIMLARRTDGTLAFNRPPRVSSAKSRSTIDIEAPPAARHTRRIPLAAAVVPLIGGTALFLFTGNVASLALMALSPLMVVAGVIDDRVGGGRERRRAVIAYRERLDNVHRSLEDALQREVQQRRAGGPDLADLIDRAESRRSTLWERRLGQEDFLSHRIGLSDQDAETRLQAPDRVPDDFRDELKWFEERVQAVPDVPVVGLRLGSTISIVGRSEATTASARSQIMQASTLHSPRDLVIVAALPAASQADWDWLKWLPHVRDSASPVTGAHIAVGPEATNALLDELGDLARSRAAFQRDRAPGTRDTAVLLLIDEDVVLSRTTIEALTAQQEGAGLSIVYTARDRRHALGDSEWIVDLDGSKPTATVTHVPAGSTIACIADLPELAEAEALGRALAGIRDTGARGSAASVPRSCGLLESAGLELSSEAMRARWATHDRGRGAILGVDATGPFNLDLRRDGPHGLVAGTTGAGKSELLQTLVASLAANYPPSRLSFLLIDYKGGAAFRRCVELPHVVGFVTDLDEHLVGRALTSLKAELRRREHVLAEHEVPELIALERTRPDAAPASLVIVIDEFASLKREMPQFVAELIEIARIGRTLGVHLLLATQRPSGVVDDHIKGNTGYSFALRVASAPDSMDVIDESAAARIPRDIPGRAFCKIGTDLTELQTAYVGGPLRGAVQGNAVEIHHFGLTATVSDGPQHSSDGSDRTELDAIVDSAIAAHVELGVAAPPSPWLPPLPTFVPLDSLAPSAAGSAALGGAGFALGLIDEPARQRQRPLVIDLETDGNLLVLGAGGSGKTSTLRSIACALVQRYSADELNLYALEFGTGGLTSLAALPHTGAVVRGDDEELVQRTIRFFRRVCDERRDLFSRHGAATLSEFRGRGSETPVPRIVVLLDDYAGFAAAYERYEFGGLIDVLHGVAADGRGLGVHLCITGARRGAVPSALVNALPQRLILRLSSEDEYGAAGLDPRTFRGAQMNPGRAFLLSGLEAQIGCLAPEPGGEAQSTAIRRLAETLAARTAGSARSIARMPVDLPAGELPAGVGWKVVVGIGGDDIAPTEIDLTVAPALICGAYRSGRSSLLALIAESLHRQVPGLTSVLLAPRRSPLTGLSCWSESLVGVEACTAGLEQLERRARESAHAPLLIVIDDGDELRDGIGLQPLEELLRIGRDHPVRVIAAAERQSARSAFSGWLKELRKDAVGCLLSPDLERDGDLFNVTLPRRVAGGMPQGRGFVVSRGASVLVQYGRADLEVARAPTS